MKGQSAHKRDQRECAQTRPTRACTREAVTSNLNRIKLALGIIHVTGPIKAKWSHGTHGPARTRTETDPTGPSRIWAGFGS